MAKRIPYSPADYRRYSLELDAILADCPTLKPDLANWDIEGDFSRAGTVLFIDAQERYRFEPILHFDSRHIKLVNYQAPAARLSFFLQHKYVLVRERDLPQSPHATLQEYINRLTLEIEIQQDKADKPTLSVTRRHELLRKISLLEDERRQFQKLQDQLDGLELVLSNYEQGTVYTQVNIKYLVDEDRYENTQINLLTSRRDNTGRIVDERKNVIFVDLPEIDKRHHPYQHKKIDRFLATFPVKSSLGGMKIYLRAREQATGTLAAVESPATAAQANPVDSVNEASSAKKQRKPATTLPLFDQEE